MSERFDTFSPWYPRPPAEAGADAVEEGGELDPREAAALLERTRRRAARTFELRPWWLTLAAAVVVLVAYGVVWLSVRHQHPYAGPAGWALAALYGTLAVWAVVNAAVLGRALSGRSSRRRRFQAFTFASIWICVYVVQGALEHAGASKGIVYGIWPAAAPLVVVGAAAAGYEAAQDRSASAGFAVAAVALGAIACFAGPAGVWGVIGIGLCVLLVAGAAVQLWQRRATAARA